jgi:DNA-binding beta-propeller fold protein YncE
LPGDQIWAKRYNTPGNDSANALAVSPDGTIFVTGGSGVATFATVAYDSSGTKLWAKRDGSLAAARAIALSPDGTTVFVTGQSTPSSTDYLTVAYVAATGHQLWAKLFDGDAHGFDSANAIAVSPDGNTVLVTGQSDNASATADYATVAYNASTGGQLWAKSYNGPAGDVDNAHAVGVSPDGTKVVVTGESRKKRAGVLFWDYATVAYDLSNGTELWVARFEGPVKGDDSAYDLALAPDGTKVFVTGVSAGVTTGEFTTLAYDLSTGTRLWKSRYQPPSGAFYEDFLVVSPDGTEVYVAGTGAWNNLDYATLAIDASTGHRLWAKHYIGQTESSPDFLHSLGVSSDGASVYVTGETFDSDTPRYSTVAYRGTDGTRLWASTYDGPGAGPNRAHGLGVSPDGQRVYVTGESGGLGDQDFATVAYTTT